MLPVSYFVNVLCTKITMLSDAAWPASASCCNLSNPGPCSPDPAAPDLAPQTLLRGLSRQQLVSAPSGLCACGCFCLERSPRGFCVVFSPFSSQPSIFFSRQVILLPWDQRGVLCASLIPPCLLFLQSTGLALWLSIL